MKKKLFTILFSTIISLYLVELILSINKVDKFINYKNNSDILRGH